MTEVMQKPATAAPFGLYIHVPFCIKKCDYCYYLSYTGQDAETIERYLKAVLAEVRWYANQPALDHFTQNHRKGVKRAAASGCV